ncbi:tyrosine-type recombinase/integrase [Rhodobacter capsulatus]|nr:integrase family protein [Rhodobacter capsulatus]
MAQRELTVAYLRGLKVEARTEISDTRETGLLVRAYPSGKITFAFRLRDPIGRLQGAVLGHYPDLGLADARALAAEYRIRVRNGDDITAKAQKSIAASQAQDGEAIPTLAAIIEEYEREMAPSRGIWERTKTGRPGDARRRIEGVFASLLSAHVTELTARDFAQAMRNYIPKSGRASANGQVSRARAYLLPVLDWCAHRAPFEKEGLGRPVSLDVVDLRKTADPASSDPVITGRRDRALNHTELGAVLQLLKWPAPTRLGMRVAPIDDIRPLACRFLLLTLARRGELEAMRWRDFRDNLGIWHKPRVKTIQGPVRQQNLPLSDAAIALLRSLPTYQNRRPDDYVFQNATGGRLGNWDRMTRAIHRESGTHNWHRHDLRRTGATILKALQVSPRVIDEILAHNAPSTDEGTTRSLEHYFASGHLLDHIEDPQKSALNQLAAALDYIETNAPSLKEPKERRSGKRSGKDR